MFYGVLQEEGYLYEDYILQEIDFKGAIETVKKKVKNAIVAFLNKVENLLNKGKDNKVKQALKTLITKIKKLLGDADNIENEADAKKINDSLNEYKEELKEIEHEYVGTVTIDILKSWLKENIKSDNEVGFIIYRPTEDVGMKSGKILKFIKKPDKLMKMYNPDPHMIHLVVWDKDKDDFSARKDIGFNELSEKTQEILNTKIGKEGYAIITK